MAAKVRDTAGTPVPFPLSLLFLLLLLLLTVADDKGQTLLNTIFLLVEMDY